MNKVTISRFPALDYACNEAMNTLCTNLSYCGSDIRVVLLTSRYESEGKSSITINMMRTMAGFGKRVLLIDTDLRRSALVRRYRLSYEQKKPYGLAHYLAGMCDLDDVIYQTDLPNASMIPAGRDVLNSMQLLASPRYGRMIEEVRSRYDMVLVDCPPAGMIVDAVEIAKYCDGAIIVVGYNNGRGQEVGEIAASIAQTGCKVLGAVINGVDVSSVSSRKYYYRSKYYSSYYRRYDRYGDAESDMPKKQKASPSKGDKRK